MLSGLTMTLLPDMFKSLYVLLPPLKDLENDPVSEIIIVDVFAFRVNPVVVTIPHGFPLVPFAVQVPDPMVKVLVLELLLLKNPVVTFLLFALSVPLLRVRALVDPRVKLSCRVKVPPNMFTFILLVKVFPDEVKVKELLP